MRVAFFGTPEFAVASLDALSAAGHELIAVVTPPDRPAGRGRELRAPAVAAYARAQGLPLRQTPSAGTPELREWLTGLAPEIAVVAAFGKIFGPKLLALPRRGCVNVHASLLPRWRGAGPIQAAIVAGDQESGVSIMQMERGLDTGPVWLARPCPIAPEDTAESLHDHLARLGGAALCEALELIARGGASPVPQDDARATHAPMWKKLDGWLEWQADAASLARRVRGLHPWPGTHTRLGGRELRILPPVEVVARREPVPPGAVVAASAGGIDICAGDGRLVRLFRLQLEGRKALDPGPFLAGHPLPVGTLLGS